MLTETQTNYLNRLSDEVKAKPVVVHQWDPKGLDIAQGVIDDIKNALPDLEVIFIGSLPLRIAGQRDIDLSVLSPSQDFPTHRPKLEELFGVPDKIAQTAIGWHFERSGYEVGVYLTDPITSKVQEQIDVFNLLKGNPDLLKEYEQLKVAANGLSYKDYQMKKYDFFNRILGVS